MEIISILGEIHNTCIMYYIIITALSSVLYIGSHHERRIQNWQERIFTILFMTETPQSWKHAVILNNTLCELCFG